MPTGEQEAFRSQSDIPSQHTVIHRDLAFADNALAKGSAVGITRVGVSIAVVAALASCGWDFSDEPATESIVTPVTTAVATLPTTTVPPTTTLPPVDPAMVDDCIDYVQYGAFTGNALLLAMWDEAGREVGTLRAMCRDIGLNDPPTLQGMSKQWRDIEAWNAAATASSTSTTAP